MRFELTVLGSSAALPAYGRYCSGQLLATEREDILVDCGEGIQMQLQRSNTGASRIPLILISHLHGDHYFGLPGLLTSWMLGGRTHPLTIISPPGLRERLSVLLELEVYVPPFALHFLEHTATGLSTVWENSRMEILAFPLRHRLPTNGYLLREKVSLPNMRKDAIDAYQIDYRQIPAIKAGGGYRTSAGQIIPHSELVTPSAPPRAYAYCSDTRYFPELSEWVRGVDLLYHESTFLHRDLDHAERTLHSTAKEAAQVASAAGVDTLVLGHFSARYPEVTPLEEEARLIFPRSYAGRELMRFTVPRKGGKQ